MLEKDLSNVWILSRFRNYNCSTAGPMSIVVSPDHRSWSNTKNNR